MKEIELFKGDCLEIMPQIEDKSIDLIFCDLPYGTTKCKWDKIIPFEELWKNYDRIIKDKGVILLFSQQPFTSELVMSNKKFFRYEWIWEKTTATGFLNANKMPLKAHENILVFYKKLPKFFPQKTTGHKPMNSYTKRLEVMNNTEIYGRMKKEISGGGATERFPRSVLKMKTDKQKEYLHSTQKPVSLLEYFIRTYTEEGDIVLDNCMGSGSTGVACKKTKRNFIGIEKEESFFDIAKHRIETFKED